MKRLMRFCLSTTLLTLSFLTHAASNTNLFQVEQAFSNTLISLNNNLATKPIYDASMTFTGSAPIANLFWVQQNGDLEDTGLNLNSTWPRQDFHFRLCSTLSINTLCNLLSPEPSHYSSIGMRSVGPSQMISMTLCPSHLGGASCEHHQVETKPALLFSTPDEGAVNSALQANNRGFYAHTQSIGFTAPIAITTSIAARFAFILEGKGATGLQHISKCSINQKTARLHSCSTTAADLSALTDVTDIALSAGGDFLYVVADGTLYCFPLNPDGSISGAPMLVSNVGQPFANITSITQSSTSEVFMLVSETDATFSACFPNRRDLNIACRTLTSIGSPVNTPKKAFIISNNGGNPQMLVADGTRIQACVLDQINGLFTYNCIGAVDFGATVNSISAPISITSSLNSLIPFAPTLEFSFVVGLNGLGTEPALGTLQTCTFSLASKATTCQAATQAALTTKAEALLIL